MTDIDRSVSSLTGPVDEDLGDLVRSLETLPPPSVNSMLAVPDPEVWRLHVRYERCRDDATRTDLFEHYEAYASRLARSLYRHGAESVEELTQVAYEALLMAIERFETERRLPFEAFARPTILGSIRRYYRDQGWAIKVPRRVHEMAGPAREAAEQLTQSLHRPPTPDEVAQKLRVDEEVVIEVNLAVQRRSPISMDTPLGQDGGSDGWSQFGTTDPNLLAIEDMTVLTEAIDEIDPEDRRLIGLYYYDEMTQSQIGEIIGCSQMQVSRRLDRIVRRLRSRVLAG